MSITSLSPKQLRQAADLKERIDGLQDQLNEILGGEVPAAKPGRKKGKKFSAEARARMAAAQKARWAAKRGEAASPATVSPVKPKRKMTAAWKKALSLAREARLAKIRAAKSSTKPQVKPKRYISPALRKARSEAMKARWAKARRAGKSRP